MKKFCCIITGIIISTSLVSCSGKNTNTANDTKPKSTVVSKVDYSKEITHFPSYKEAKLMEFTPASEKAPLANAKYKIENTTDVKVYEYFEDTLKKDGWTITDGKKHFSIAAKKDAHVANIIIQKMDKDVILVVTSK